MAQGSSDTTRPFCRRRRVDSRWHCPCTHIVQHSQSRQEGGDVEGEPPAANKHKEARENATRSPPVPCISPTSKDGTGKAETYVNTVEVWADVCHQHLQQTHKEQFFGFRDGRKHKNPPAQRVIPNVPALADAQVKVNRHQPLSWAFGDSAC